MSLKEEIGGIIYDADIYKAKVTTGQLNNIVDDIMKEIEKRIDLMIKEESQGSLYNMASDSVLTLKQVKELLK